MLSNSNLYRCTKGTAVTVQSMVFGNMGDTSGTGVCFTRNPSTGVGLDVALHTRYVCMPDLSGLYLA